MRAKLAIAVCCLLVAVQARPTTEPKTCATSCPSRSTWTGYQIGKTYKYQFQHEVEVSSDLSEGQSSRMLLSGVASVEVHSECEMALKVDVQQTQATDSDDSETLNPRETPAQLREALLQPLRFSYEDGKISHICPSGSETRVSLNIKRGLLSQLQVSVANTVNSLSVTERDILGECTTHYETEGREILVKTKNFASCKLGFKIFPPTSVKALDEDKTIVNKGVTQGSLKCRITLNSMKNLVKETICEENHEHPIEGGSKPLSERVLVKTRLTLQDEVQKLDSTLTEVQERTGLGHGHMTSKECRGDSYWQDGSGFEVGAECGERKRPTTGRESSDHKEAAKKILLEICNTVKSQKFERDSAQKYSHLIKYLRGVTSFDDVQDLYLWATTSSECKSNSFFRLLVRSAIGATGTKEMMEMAMKQFEMDEDKHQSWLIDALWNTKNPTSDMLEPIMRYFQSKSWDEEEVQNQASIWYGLADLTHRICVEDDNCESDPKVKSVIDFFSDKFEKACRLPTPEDESQGVTADRVAITSVSNLGRVRGGVDAIVKCALKKEVPASNRLAALDALRRFSKWSFDEIIQLTEVLGDRRLTSELRILAFQILTKFDLTVRSPLTTKVKNILEQTDENEQVQYYIFTYLKNVKNLPKQIRQIIQNPDLVTRMERLNRMRYSNNVASSFTSRQLGRGVQFNSDLIFSNSSVLPRSINFNLSLTNPMLGRTQNLLDFSLRLNSMEEILLAAYKELNSQYKTWNSRKRREVDWSISDEQKKMEPPKEQPRLEFSLRHNGATTSQIGIPASSMRMLPIGIKMGINAIKKGQLSMLKDMIMHKVAESNPLAKVGTLTDETISIPTIAGLPILLKKESHFLVKTDAEMPELPTSSKFSINWTIRPNAAVQMTRTFGVDAVFQRAGIQTKTSLLSSTGVKIILQSNLTEKNNLGLSLKLESLQKQEVADVKTEVNFFQHNSQGTSKKSMKVDDSRMQEKNFNYEPSENYFGHRLQVSGRYLKSKGVARSLMLAPSHCTVTAEKLPDFGTYEASLKLVNKEEEKTLEVLMGDRNSVEENGLPKYLWKLLIQQKKKEKQVTVKFDLLNRLWPVQLHLTSRSTATSQYEVGVFYRFMKTVGRGQGTAVYSDDKQLNANFTMEVQTRPDSDKSRYEFQLVHKFHDNYFFLLPLANSKLTMKYPDSSELELKYIFEIGRSLFNWQTSAILKHSTKYTNIVMNRIKTSWVQEGTKSISTFLYDFELGSRKGSLLTHSCHAKFINNKKNDAEAKLTGSFSHMLKLNGRHTPANVETRFSMNTNKPGSGGFDGSGDLTLTTYSNETPGTNVYTFTDIVVHAGKRPIDQEKPDGDYADYYTFSFICPTKKLNRVSLSVMPLKKWTMRQQYISFELIRTTNSQPTDYILKVLHHLNLNAKQLSQIVQLNADKKFSVFFQQTVKQQGTDLLHQLITNSSFMNPMKMNSKLTFDEKSFIDRSIKAETEIQINQETVFKASQQLESKKIDTTINFHLTTLAESSERKFTYDVNYLVDDSTMANLGLFLQYQMRIFYGRYYMTDSLQLLLNLLKVVKYSKTHQLTITNPSRQFLLENSIDVRKTDGVVFNLKVENRKESELSFKLGAQLKKKTSRIDSVESVGYEIHVAASEKTIDTKFNIEYPVTTADKYKVKISIESKDNMNWHDVKSGVEMLREDGELKLKASAEGKVAAVSLDHKMEFVFQNKDELEIRAEIEGTPVYVSSEKFKVEFSLNRKPDTPLKAILEVKKDDKDVCAVKVNAQRQGLKVVVTSAFEILKKIGLSLNWTPTPSGLTSYGCVFKLNGFGRNIEYTEKSSVKANFDTSEFLVNIAMKSETEIKGLEELISNKKMQHSLKFQVAKTYEFDTEYSVTDEENVPLAQYIARLKFSPFLSEAKLKVNYNSKTNRFGFRISKDDTSAFVGFEFFDRETVMKIETQDEPDKTKKIFLHLGTNFFKAEKPLTSISATGKVSWPLTFTNFDGSLEVELPLETVKKVNVKLLNKLKYSTELESLQAGIEISADIDGKTQKFIEGKYIMVNPEQPSNFLLQIDTRSVMENFPGFAVGGSLQLGGEFQDRTLPDGNFLLLLNVSSIDKSVTFFVGKIFSLTNARQFDGIPHGMVNLGCLFTIGSGTFYLVRKPETDVKNTWKLDLSNSGWDTKLTATVSVTNGLPESGDLDFFGEKLRIDYSTPGQFDLFLSGSDTPKYRLKWTKTFNSWTSLDWKLEVEADTFKGVGQLMVNGNDLEVNYGKKESPNSLKATLKVTPTFELTINHKVNDEGLQVTILPGVSVPIGVPFELSLVAQSPSSLSISVKLPILKIQTFTYSHELTTSGVIQVDSKLLLTQQTDEYWKTKVDINVRSLSMIVESRLSDKYTVILNSTYALVKINNVAELTLQMSNKEQMTHKIRMDLPILNLQPIEIKIVTSYTPVQKTVVHFKHRSIDLTGSVTLNKFPAISEFEYDVEVGLVSNSGDFRGIRSLGLQLVGDTKKSGSQFTSNNKIVTKVNSDIWHTIDTKVRTETRALPVELAIISTGFIDSQFKYILDDTDGVKKFEWKMKNWGSIRRKYDLLLHVGELSEGSLIRNFNFSLVSPKRHYQVSKKVEKTDSIDSVTCQFFLNKKLKHGFTTKYVKEITSTQVKQTYELDLPTRKISLTRKSSEEGQMVVMDTSLAWDAEKDASKVIDVTTRVPKMLQYGTDIKMEVECQAPFLKSKEKFEYTVQYKSNGGKVQLKRVNSSGMFTVNIEYSVMETDDGKQMLLKFSTNGSSDDHKSVISLKVTSKNLDGESKVHKGQLTLSVPAKSVDRSFHFEFIPNQELTMACDKGYFVNLARFNSLNKWTVSVTVAGLNKISSRFSVSLNKQKSQVKLELTSGDGHFDAETERVSYSQKTTAISAKAGLAQEEKRLFVAVYFGQVDSSKTLSLFNAEGTPGSVGFFIAGLNLESQTRVNYYAHWRQRLSSSGQTFQKEIAMAALKAFRSTVENSLPMKMPVALRGVAEAAINTMSQNVNTEVLVQEVSHVSSNDIDSLKAYARQAMRNNEFFVRDISRSVGSTAEVAGRVVETLRRSINDIPVMVQILYRRMRKTYSSMGPGLSDYCKTLISSTQESLKGTVYLVYQICNEAYNSISETLNDSGVSAFVQTCRQQMYSMMAPMQFVGKSVQDLLGNIRPFLISLFQEIATEGAAGPFTDVISFITDLTATVTTNYAKYSNSKREMREFLHGSAQQSSKTADASLVIQLLKTVTSKDAIKTFKDFSNELKQGRFKGALKELLKSSNNRVYQWEMSSTNSIINGSMDVPVFMQSMNPSTWKARYEVLQKVWNSLNVAWKKIFITSSDGYVVMSALNDWRLRGSNLMDPVLRLLSVPHRTAVIQGNRHIITFDGVTIYHKKPCSYLLAHDFNGARFSVFQTYKKEGGKTVRDKLQVGMGSLKVSISRDGVFKVNGETKTLPTSINGAKNSVEADVKGGSIVAKFHGEVENTLIVSCSRITDSCVVQVHPLFVGKVVGAAGSMDDRRTNDIRGDAQQHMRLWTAGECLEAGDATAFTNDEEDPEEPMTDDQCQRWFSKGESSFDKCFDTVKPQPFRTMCRNYMKDGKDICQVAMLYTQMCRSHSVNINVKCSPRN